MPPAQEEGMALEKLNLIEAFQLRFLFVPKEHISLIILLLI